MGNKNRRITVICVLYSCVVYSPRSSEWFVFSSSWCFCVSVHPFPPVWVFSLWFQWQGAPWTGNYQVFLIGLTPSFTAFTNRFRSSSSALRFPKSEIHSFLTVINIIIIYYIHSNRSTIINQQHHFIDQSTTSFHRYSPGDHSRLQVLLCGHEQ